MESEPNDVDLISRIASTHNPSVCGLFSPTTTMLEQGRGVTNKEEEATYESLAITVNVHTKRPTSFVPNEI
jgi:hypothetical protein